MSAPKKRYCVFRCDALAAQCVPLHRFPHPEKHPDRFAAWMTAVGDRLNDADPMKIFKNKRICDLHFEVSHKATGRRLIRSAVPTLNLNRVCQTSAAIVEMDHNYCLLRREHMPMADITNIPGPSTSGSSYAVAAEIAVCPFPSGSTSQTCLTMPHVRSHKYDADKTREYLREKAREKITKKARRNQHEIARLRSKVKNYKLRLRQMKKLEAEKDFEKLSQNMSESAKLFTRMQFKEGQKKNKGHRFTLKEKVLSLSIYKKSPKAYKLMCKHFTLPSRKILKSLLAQLKLLPGINNVIFTELKRTVSKMLPQDRLCTLIFDEMSISPQIQYNVYTDDLVGFENYGKKKTPLFADHVLVFMVKGIKKNFKQPIAYYFTQALKASALKDILIKVITSVQATGLKVLATICDQSMVNVSAVNSLIALTKANYLRREKEWRGDVININGSEIIPLYDVPHLIKGIRNNMLNKEMIYTHENEIKSIKWEYLQWVYLADKTHGELRLLPKLTAEHIDPNKIKKMRVKNAAQVLSHSMAVATDCLAARGDIPLECRNLIPFILTIDKLFDSFNASSFSIPNGKIYRAAVKRNSPHHKLWQEALKLLKSVKFMVEKSDGSSSIKTVPTIVNLIKTIEGFKSLWQLLVTKYSLDAMLTRNINQDPLENFFGGIRNLGARNTAPNCVGFEGAFKTLLLNNFSSNHAINSNCEDDDNECLQSLSFLLKSKNECTALPSQSIVIDLPLDVMQNSKNISDSGADQRTYVCGWTLTKCLQRVVKSCKRCRSKLLSNSEDEANKFIRAKEFTKNKRWLCYPSDCLVACFQEIQDTTIAFLNSDCHEVKIKERIKAFLQIMADFSFMDCEIHRDKLKECFLDTSINIILFSWCRAVNRILDGKMFYEGSDIIKKAAQSYYNKHKKYKE